MCHTLSFSFFLFKFSFIKTLDGYNGLRNKQKWMERGVFTSDILGMLCLLVLSSDVSVSCVCVGRVCGVWVRISGRVWMDCWWCQWEAECNNTGMTDLLKGMREDPRASQPYLYSSHWCPRSQCLPIMLHRCQTVTVVWKKCLAALGLIFYLMQFILSVALSVQILDIVLYSQISLNGHFLSTA